MIAPTIIDMDTQWVGARARPMDVLEARALVDLDPVTAALRSAKVSAECWTWWDSREPGGLLEPGAIFGAVEGTILGGSAVIWMMTTDLVDVHRVRFLRGSQKVIHRLRETYGRLETEVDARHEACLRWMAWLGFTIRPARIYGAARVPFHHVEIGA